jgi:ABC-2 type transport system permease protein
MKRFNVIFAVFKKEFIQLIRYPTWLIQLIIWPLIFPLVYILSAMGYSGPDRSGLAVFKAAAGTTSFEGYIIIGVMVWMWVNVTMWSYGSFLRDEQMRGTLESNWLCPIKKIDLLIGGGLVCMFEGIVQTVISIIEYRFVYGIEFTGNILLWLVLFAIISPAIYGLGAFLASLVLWLKEVGAAVNVVRGLVMMICGITFPVTVMPIWLQKTAEFIPFTYGINAARDIMIKGLTLYDTRANIGMCLLEGFILLILGRIAFSRIEKKVKTMGSLERF